MFVVYSQVKYMLLCSAVRDRITLFSIVRRRNDNSSSVANASMECSRPHNARSSSSRPQRSAHVQ